MTTAAIPTTIKQIVALVKQGEDAALEFKRSTGWGGARNGVCGQADFREKQ